jgi:hypothetical protein
MAALAEIAHHMGDKREAVTLYRKLFDRAVAASDEEMILERARTLLRLDPSLDEVARKRIEVETGMYRKNKARRRKVRVIIFGCLGLAVVASLGVMEWSARRALSTVRQLEDGFIERQQVDKAVARYNEFLDKYAWTLAAGDARDRRDQLEERLVRKELPEAVKLDEAGNTYAALEKLDKILEVSRSEKAVKEVREVRARFEKHRAEIEGEKLAEARKIIEAKTPERVKELRSPLAIPALKLLLAEKNNPALRRAAVAALGEVGKPAIETLIGALAEEGESGELRGEILATLKKGANGADYGMRAQDWEEWHLGETKRPLQALVLDAGSGMVEWRVLNVGRDTIKLDLLFGPVFKVTTADGKELPMSIAFEAPAARRPIKASLKPGQFVGGRALLKDLVDVKGAEGQQVRVSWSLKLEGGEGDEGKLVSLPVRVEVKK